MEKQRWEESERRRAEERKSEKKEDAGARKGGKVTKHSVFPMICGSGGSKSRLAKAAGAEPCGQMRDEKLHAVVARSTFRSQNVQTPHSRSTFRSWDIAKSARHCGAKHMWKSKCTNQTMFGALLEVAMLTKCTPLWREAHFEVKSVKNWRSRATFGRSDVVSHGRRRGLCTKWAKREDFVDFVAVPTTTTATPHSTTTTTTTTLHYTALITLHYATLHCTTLRYTTLHKLQLQLQLHYTTLHYITLRSYPTTNATATTLHQLHYTKTTTPLHYNYNYSCATPHYIQLTDQVTIATIATIATIPKNTAPTTFQSISGFALPSVIHNNQPPL